MKFDSCENQSKFKRKADPILLKLNAETGNYLRESPKEFAEKHLKIYSAVERLQYFFDYTEFCPQRVPGSKILVYALFLKNRSATL